MTRKDYRTIAKGFKNSRPDVEIILIAPNTTNQWVLSVAHMVSVLVAENPRFDSIKFYDACGYTSLMKHSN